MKFKDFELELIVNRLMVGYTIFEINDTTIFFKNPTAETKYKLNLLLKKHKNKNKFRFASRSELEFVFFDKMVLEPTYNTKLDNLTERIEDLKYDLFMAGPLVETERRIRTKLVSSRQILNDYYNHISSLFYYSYEEVVNRLQIMYTILLNCFYENGRPVFDLHNIDYSFFKTVSEEIKKNTFSSVEIREIARSNLWRSYWLRGKESCFINHVSSFNEEQKLLCAYSHMYDNALSRSDFPDYILNDDDKFDGWMIKQRRDIEDNNKANNLQSFTKGKTYDFITRAATTQEEANNIYNMNTREGLQKIRSRATPI